MTPVYAAASSAAPQLQYEPGETRHAPASNRRSVTTEPAQRPRKPITYQPSLFTSRELPRVVPFETIAPESVEAPPKTAVSTRPRVRQRKAIPGQQNLEFSPSRYAKPSDGVIICDAPVALPAHRGMAAALDTSIILIALAVFGLIFRLAGGAVVLNARTIPEFAGIVAAVVVFYKLLWCLANGDTPGMKWTRLMLVNFDGQTPNRKQRLLRLAASILSVLAAGLGLLWVLVDEETLTWHDHISKTFPTPY
jgi:uncharacterized RDD family membrane protein YckC